jgi:hypothetical protein
MTATIVALSLSLALSSTGQGLPPEYTHDHIHGHVAGNGHHHGHSSGDHIVPPGPGDGWGFPNGNPDHYGWVNYGTDLPLGVDRTPDYYFPRFLSVPPEQMFIQTYYDCYQTRGQRYIPYAGSGGEHPMGGAPDTSAELPFSPFGSLRGQKPVIPVPHLNGRVEAEPIPSGGSGLTP